METRWTWAVVVVAATALGACGSAEEIAAPTSSSAVITDSQRGVLLAEAACSVLMSEDAEAAFGRTVVGGGNEVGECRFVLEPGLGGASQLVVEAALWPGGEDLRPQQFFEEQRVKDQVVEVPGIGFPALYDPVVSVVWTLVEPSNATLPGRAADLGPVENVVLELQVLLPGVGVAPDDARDEIRSGLSRLAEVVAPRL
ncbi:MAG: hypothetical protein ABIJ48_11690 [Actinomycetota bacterium]